MRKDAQKIPYGLIGRVILGVVGAAGIVGVGLMAPGAFQIVKLIREYQRLAHRRYEAPSYIRRTLKSFERRGMVRISVKAGDVRVYLTGKGEQELLKYQLQEKRLKHGRWDGKWRIIIFDIEEKLRFARDGIRSNMESFGFVKLQESVWVYPFECEEVATLLKAHYKLGKQLVYILAGDIENDVWLRKYFKLNT